MYDAIYLFFFYYYYYYIFCTRYRIFFFLLNYFLLALLLLFIVNIFIIIYIISSGGVRNPAAAMYSKLCAASGSERSAFLAIPSLQHDRTRNKRPSAPSLRYLRGMRKDESSVDDIVAWYRLQGFEDPVTSPSGLGAKESNVYGPGVGDANKLIRSIRLQHTSGADHGLVRPW